MASRTITGKMSYFGGPEDTTGVSPSEGLALCEPSEVHLFPDTMFLPEQPPNTTGLARRLNPDYPYCAARWDYNSTPRDYLQSCTVIVTNVETGKSLAARPIDWGPNQNTGRAMDLSPGLCEKLGLQTDDTATMVIQLPAEAPVTKYGSIVISSGHGLHIRGAAGPAPWGLDEVNEARKVVDVVAEELEKRGVEVDVFHDDTSSDQNTNLHTIVDHHNSRERDLDVSVHFNAFDQTAHGTECLYVTQNTLANQISSGVAAAGPFTNRGGKKRTDLYFLNQTTMPSVLVEVAFCDNHTDCDTYRAKFQAICKSLATTISGSTALKSPGKRAAPIKKKLKSKR